MGKKIEGKLIKERQALCGMKSDEKLRAEDPGAQAEASQDWLTDREIMQWQSH